ncbi:MAG: autotransporter-associated beta strand repeat-containing protein, partial [Kiritimatiellales bacterium]|nr:autotransporter-associated beta strand repeat-containing protein [Kiritimatiellales bacterium]
VAGTIGAAAVPGASESVVLHTTTASGGANDRRDTIKLNADREATSIEVLPGAGFDANFDVDESDLFVIKRGSTTPRTLTLHGTRPIYFRNDGTEVGRTLRFDALGSTGANGDADLVFAGTGDATITIEGTTDVIEVSYDIIDGISSNAARLIKDGAGLLVLNTPRTNTYSGDWQIDQGELRIGDGTVRGNIGSGNVQVNGGTLALNRSNGVSVSNPMDLHDGSMILARLGGNTISGEVMMNATKGMTVTLEAAFGTTLDLLPGNAIELDDTTLLLLGDGEGAIGKSLALDGKNATIIKDGSGIWSLSNPDNNWSAGGVMIGNGVLKLGGDEVIPHGTGKGAVTIESAGTLDLAGHTERINDLLGNGTVDNTSGESAVLKLGAASAAGTFDGMIQNSGSPLTLHKVNGGINTLGGSNTFSGGVAIFNGVLKLGNKYALGAANLLTMKNDSTGTLQLDRYFPTFAGLVSDGTVGDSVIENSHAANTAILNVDVASGQRHVYRDTLRDGGAAPLRLVKKGPGTQVLDTAANTELSCSGNTTIQDGTLVMNAIFTGGGSFTVWSAGTLAGNGAINTTVTVNGTVAPGDELGTLTVNGDLDLNGTYRCQIAGDSVDQLAVGGNLDISSAILKVEEVSSPGKPVYIIATYGSLTGDSFTSVVNLPTGYEVDTAYNGNQIALVKRPVMDISQEAEQGAIINWEGHSNSTYSLLFKSNLFDSIWMPIAAYTNLPGLPDISVTNPVPGKSRGFFLMQMD